MLLIKLQLVSLLFFCPFPCSYTDMQNSTRTPIRCLNNGTRYVDLLFCALAGSGEGVQVAERPNVPHLKPFQGRGSFIAHCCAINRYFNLHGRLLAPWLIEEVAASMPGLFCTGGLSRRCMSSHPYSCVVYEGWQVKK